MPRIFILGSLRGLDEVELCRQLDVVRERGLARRQRHVGRALGVEELRREQVRVVLLRLAGASGGRLRRVDLAGQVLLTPSGITRLLDGLERAGLVARGECAADRRVVYAELTEAGAALVREAGEAHVEDIRGALEACLAEDELQTLDGLLARLPGGEDDGTCRAPADEPG
jgi:DNA-binding MarR family transcriptional regulator